MTALTMPPNWPARRLLHVAVAYLLPLAVVAIAISVLHHLVADVHWADVKADLARALPQSLLLALAGTAVSFLALGFYDILAVQAVAAGRVPASVAWLAGAAGNAVSNLLGFSYVTGTAIRYRVYASLGLDLATVALIMATTWLAFWLGLVLLLGLLLAFHPVGISTVLPVGRMTEVLIGAGLLVALGVLLAWLSRDGRTVRFRGRTFRLPSARFAGQLTLAGTVEVAGSALALYALMPADLAGSIPYFLVVYILAQAVGILSHSPGGLGVFEAGIIAGFGASGRSDVLAALLLYRLIYTLMPFAVASLGIALVWGFGRRDAVTGAASWSYRLARPVVPAMAAGICLLAGTILLVSGNLPAEGARLGVLRDLLPLSFVEASHLAGSVIGLLLIVISRGLYRRLHRAWFIAMALMAGGFVACLARGLDWEEAVLLVGFMALLGLFRSAFYRRDPAPLFRLDGAWIASILALLAAIVWVGFFAYSNVEYRDQLWWQFAWQGDASRFLRASLAGAVVLALVGFDSIVMRSPRRRPGRQPIPDVVRKLLSQSEDTDAGLALMGDKAFLVAEDGAAFIAYGDGGRALIARGDPVGEAGAGQELVWRFRELADRSGRLCAFYAVSPAYLATYLDMGLSILKIGEVARVDLTDFTLDTPSRRRFRQARNRAERDGCEFAIVPAAELGPFLPQLRRISDAWLASKHGQEKAFSLGFFDEDYVANFDCAVLRELKGGPIVAFANLFQGANRHELSLDLMRHLPDGPKFAMDALFAELMLWGAAQGFRWFSLGAAPLAGMESRELASLWNRVGGFVYAHGEHFYNFEGLREFKQKFDPVWTPNYLASPGGLAVPRILYEVNMLVSGGLKGLVR